MRPWLMSATNCGCKLRRDLRLATLQIALDALLLARLFARQPPFRRALQQNVPLPFLHLPVRPCRSPRPRLARQLPAALLLQQPAVLRL